MNCKICGSELKTNKCPECNYEVFKTSLFGRFFSKEKSEIIARLDDFFRFFNDLKYLDSYISRSFYISTIELYKEDYNFVKELSNTQAINRFAKENEYALNNLFNFINLYENFESEIDKLNSIYINRKLETEKEYLDNILKEVDSNILLDEDQRKAILTDEDYCLIIAGAGAGKTTTMAAKVKYLVEKEGINEKDILVVSYTNKAVNELKEKINALNINPIIETFHKIGYTFIAKEDETKNKVFGDKHKYRIIQEFLKSEILKDLDLLKKLIIFFGYYLNVPEDILKFNNIEEYFAYIEKTDFSTLRSNLSEYNRQVINQRTKELVTINNEFLKSMQEVQIANFLYLNKVDYIYEEPYKYKIPGMNRRYTPDFVIKQDGKVIYIEHFGITEDKRNSLYSNADLKKYIKQIQDKKNLHHKYQTTLICTYSSYNDGRDLLTHLEEELIKHGIKLEKRDDKEVFNKIISQDKDKYFYKFSFLALKFLGLFKTKGYTEKDFGVLRTKTKSPRTLLFLDVMERLYLYYQNYLKKHNAIDFEDMINDAANILTNKENLRYSFKYIIVDEYQDISRQRFNLAKAISDLTGAKVVAVGDDWQSIFSFAGSEITLFTEFVKVFGYGKELKITRTYRNAQEVIDIAGDFIQKNSTQIKKELKSIKTIKQPVVIYTYNSSDKKMNEMASKVSDTIGRILKNKKDPSKHQILLIGRYGFDGEKLGRTNYFEFDYKTRRIKSKEFPAANLTFLTAHSSKGLGFDDVIIINAENSIYGFPAQIEDDPILKLVRPKEEEMVFAEERRLFYVALTRTKNRVFIITPEDRPSKFVLELLKNYETITLVGNIDENPKEIRKTRLICPECGYPVQARIDSNFGFKIYVCMNEPELCGFVTNDMNCDKRGIHYCDECDGYMIVRYNRNEKKYFYGCTNFKDKNIKCQNSYGIEK